MRRGPGVLQERCQLAVACRRMSPKSYPCMRTCLSCDGRAPPPLLVLPHPRCRRHRCSRCSPALQARWRPPTALRCKRAHAAAPLPGGSLCLQLPRLGRHSRRPWPVARGQHQPCHCWWRLRAPPPPLLPPSRLQRRRRDTEMCPQQAPRAEAHHCCRCKTLYRPYGENISQDRGLQNDLGGQTCDLCTGRCQWLYICIKRDTISVFHLSRRISLLIDCVDFCSGFKPQISVTVQYHIIQ